MRSVGHSSAVLIVGMGGLGCPAAWTLAERGVSLGLCDPDKVELSNLHRQILHRTSDIGRLKVDSARDALDRRFPGVIIENHAQPFGPDILSGYSAVIDATDSIDTKFALSDLCVARGVPLVHGAASGFHGQLMSVMPGQACYRCLFESPPEQVITCDDGGVLGPFAGLVGVLQAEEAIRILEGQPTLAGKLLVLDGRTGARRTITFHQRTDCTAHFQKGAFDGNRSHSNSAA